ncbi:hypothetical protein [Corynebacterium sp.]|uniref:hypothetical protein n=1 Tax=Corynebacterium sp. TaxID=1720 RepID=UPI003736B485
MNNALDPVLRPLDRLRICAALKAAGDTEGGDAALAGHLTALRHIANRAEN